MQILQDIAYSLRLLRKTPLFTTITLVVIVLGLSLYLASYSLVETFYEEPLPFPNGDRYVSLKAVYLDSGADDGTNVHDAYLYNRLKERSNNYSLLGAFSNASLVLSDGEYTSTFSGSLIEPELMAAFSVEPVLGRLFSRSDQVPGAAPVVIISHALWQDYYAGDVGVIGRVSQIDGRPYTVVGVMPESFNFPVQQSLWLPLTVSGSSQPGEGPLLSLVGILAADSSQEAADAELKSILSQLGTEFPETYANLSGLVTPFASIYSPSNIQMPLIMNIISMIILALAVVNLSSLLFMRANTRRQELAIRSSVGANGWQLAKQVLLESFTICFFGFILSLLISSLILVVLHSVLENSVDVTPFWMQSGLDWRAIATGAVGALGIWLASGFIVAYKAYRNQPGAVLGSASQGAGHPESAKATSAVVVIEIALSCFLLICCGIFVNLVMQLTNADYGAGTENLITGEFSLSHPDYIDDRVSQLAYVDNLTQAVSEVPGITSAAITSQLAHVSGLSGSYDLEDRNLVRDRQLPAQTTYWVSINYFETVDLPIVSGRQFDSGDTAFSENVVIVNEDFAQQLWPDQSVLGKRIKSILGEQEQWLTVVGVVPGVLTIDGALTGVSTPRFYRPLTQGAPQRLYLVAQHSPETEVNVLRPQIARAASRVDRNIPVDNIFSMEEEVSLRFGATPVFGQIFVEFSLGTLALACIGIYGVVGRSIYQRTQEVGIRRALGSTDFRIVSRFIRNGFYFLLAGLMLGGVPAYILAGGSLSAFGLRADFVNLPAITLAVLAIMTALVATACYLPARKAVAMEPGDALRYE